MPRLFLALWLASLVSVLGTSTHEVAASWLMTSLRPEPWLVSLVSVASSLPFFVLVLPAGVWADRFDRRGYLLLTQSWMALCALTLAWLSASARVTPTSLLLLTLLLSVGAALNSPAWHSLTAEVVERDRLPQAVTWSGFAINAGRTLGPALGGWLVARWAPAAAFAFNALSFAGVILVLACWRRGPQPPPPPSGLREGLRLVWRSPALRAVLRRTLLFGLPASAPLALLPLLVRQAYAGDSREFGLLVTAFGVGSLLGSSLAAGVSRPWSPDRQLRVASGLYALGLGLLGSLPQWEVGLLAQVLAGVAWMLALNQLHTATLLAAEASWRSRATAAYLLALFGSSTLGSALWGALGQAGGLSRALQAAALLAGLGVLVTFPPGAIGERDSETRN